MFILFEYMVNGGPKTQIFNFNNFIKIGKERAFVKLVLQKCRSSDQTSQIKLITATEKDLSIFGCLDFIWEHGPISVLQTEAIVNVLTAVIFL